MGTFAAPSTSAVGDAGRTGVSSGWAAEDHQHPREGFAAPTGQDQGAGSAGVATTVPRSDHAHPFDTFTHLDYGMLGWNGAPFIFSNQTAAGSPFIAGTVNLAKVIVPVGVTVSNLLMMMETAGSVLTSGQCFAALYSAAGALLQTTADQAVAWGATATLKIMAITPQPIPAGACYVAWFFNGTTPPRFAGTVGGVTTLINANLSAANSIWASADVGRTTTMPASLGAFTALNQGWWVGLT